MVRHGLKHIFQKPTPDIDSSDRTQQLRAKTVYAGTVNLAQTLVNGNNNRYKTYNGPYEVSNQSGNSNVISSQSYDDLLSITKGKVLLNQLPLNSSTQEYYQKNFAKGQMYEGNYNRFDPSFNFVGHTGCNDSVLVYDISTPGFTGPSSYDTNGGFIGVTGPGPTGTSASNKHIFIDPNHCYYSDPCLLDASYTRFVSPGLTGATGPAQFNAQQIINADQYRGFSYPMPNFTLMCAQEIPDQQIGPLFCPQPPTPITAVMWEYTNSPPTDLTSNITPTYNGSAFTIRVKGVVPANAKYKLTGITSVTNASDPPAQITLTGSQYFTSSITSPSIRVVPVQFTATWEYTNDGGSSYNDLTGNITPTYTSSLFTIRLKGVVPANATFTPSGVASITNVGDPQAQLIITGSGNFAGSVITSPSIRVVPALFTATWEYTNNGGSSYNDLTGNITPTYTSSPFTIRLKATAPANATFTPSGVASITNVGDPQAQVVLTGSGNFSGSAISSPSIRVNSALFTATWKYTTDGGSTYTDLNSSGSSFVYNSSSPVTYTIAIKTVAPSNATFTQSGAASVTNIGLAQLTLTGSGNFMGSVTSPPIRVTPPEINIYNKTSGTNTKSVNDPPNFNGNGNNLVFGYTNTVDTTGNYYVSSATNPSLTFDNTKPLYLYFFTPLANPPNPETNPNAQVWLQNPTYLKGTATLTFDAANSKYVSTSDNNFVLQSGQTYWTIWSQTQAGAFNTSNLSMLIYDGGTGNWQWQGTLNVAKV
jgi:hypothetical protein